MTFLEYLFVGAIGGMVGAVITAYILCEQFKRESEEHCRECTAKRRGLI